MASAILIFSTARIGKVIYSSEIGNIISGGITDTYDDTDQNFIFFALVFYNLPFWFNWEKLVS